MARIFKNKKKKVGKKEMDRQNERETKTNKGKNKV